MTLKNILFSFLFLHSLVSCGDTATFNPDNFDGTTKVVSVADGDSFVGLDADNHQTRFRMYGIDAPERGQAFSKKSRQYFSDLIAGKSVFYEVKTTDRYGRKVVRVFTTDSVDVGLKMLEAGLVWHYSRYDDSRAYARAENEARKAKSGLWAEDNPTPPWEWRTEKRAEQGL